MTSRRRPPTAAELVHWLRVASPPAVTGTYRWEPAEGEGHSAFGWHAYAGSKPVPAFVPPRVDVAFWHAAPDRWRLEIAGQLFAVSDGTAALSTAGGRVVVGTQLLAPNGPARLVHPSAGRHLDVVAEGTAEPLTMLARTCWRWSGDETWWIDHETGIALQHDDDSSTARLLDVSFPDSADPALFVPPPELLAAAEQVEGPADDEDDHLPHPRWEPDFTVPWWPHGTLTYPQRGDASVPEGLFVLPTDGGPQLWLGVAPAPRPAPTRQRAQRRTWSGEGWSFALCWRGRLDDDLVDRIVTSVPARWEL